MSDVSIQFINSNRVNRHGCDPFRDWACKAQPKGGFKENPNTWGNCFIPYQERIFNRLGIYYVPDFEDY